MNHSKLNRYVVGLLAGLVALIAACKHDPDPGPTPVLAPTLASFNPPTATIGSSVTVTGANFGTDPASNTVTIGGVPAVVTAASSGTALVITVPAGIPNNSGVISVSAAGGNVQSSQPFVVAVKPVVSLVPIAADTTIRANVRWTRDNVYLLQGRVYIPTGNTLTIEPGTVIRGVAASGNKPAGTLIIERGGKLIATGTASQPIVFTSAKPAGQRGYGDWGGIVFEGYAPVNRPGSTTFPANIRGTTETYDNPDDNSGALQYVRIEFAGLPTGELGGLSLYGVGYGTQIDHVQVSYSRGNGFAWYGGTSNAKYLVSYRNSTADWYTDWGYGYGADRNGGTNGGKVQFGVALRDQNVATPPGGNAIYSQNFDPGEYAGGTAPTKAQSYKTSPIFANISAFGFSGQSGAPSTAQTGAGGSYGAALYLRRNTAISVYNSVFVGFPIGVQIEGTTTGTLANLTATAGSSYSLDLRGIVIANSLSPEILGGGDITTDVARGYFLDASRSNKIYLSAEVPQLLLNAGNFNLTNPSFLPQSTSPLQAGAVKTGKVADSFFTSVDYRGAFGADNWTQGWTNFNPQNTDYDRQIN